MRSLAVNRRKASPYHSLEKAFRILELLAERSPRGVTEIASRLSLDKSSVSRLGISLLAVLVGRKGLCDGQPD